MNHKAKLKRRLDSQYGTHERSDWVIYRIKKSLKKVKVNLQLGGYHPWVKARG